MANWLTETIRPRSRAGLISAMYIGLVIEAAPTPIPPIMRKIMSWLRVRGIAVPMAETKNRIAERISTLRRPKRSLITPAPATPMMQPTRAQAAVQPFVTRLRSKWVSRNSIAPLITAVS